MKYDPLITPKPETWLGLDEQERIALIRAQHEGSCVELPNPTLHAAMHTVVENQLALKDNRVQETLDRLMSQGLDRHEALHAIGSVLAEQIWSAMQEDQGDRGLPEAYYRGLDALSAQKWRNAR